ncbi:MAG: helix-turn-helix domain-containing protein [Clostridia bacterium]|nr:helix-turn-helix domain-containing protein [Clostridia bacterium]
MRLIEPEDLRHADLFCGRPEVFPESWASRKHFSLYKETPRPCCALFFIKSDIRVSFFSHSGDTVIARRGDVVFIPQGALYHVSVEGGTPNCIDTYTVNFSLLDHAHESVILSEHIRLLSTRSEGLVELHFQKLNEAVHDSDEGGNLLSVRAALYALLDAVVSAASGAPDAYYAIRRGADALCREWNRNEKIETYAALCGVSKAYFYRCFREWTGKSPVEYRNAQRLSNAETMLRHTDMQIREIAEIIGFEDPFYFCRIFAKRFGLSPQKYRMTARGSEG